MLSIQGIFGGLYQTTKGVHLAQWNLNIELPKDSRKHINLLDSPIFICQNMSGELMKV